MCHSQLAQLREKLDEIREVGAQLLAIDPHEVWSSKYLLEEVGFQTSDIHYPLLMDSAHVVSALYGVAFQMRIHTELSNRPTTFVIDRQGVIRYEHRAKAFNDRPTPEEIVEVLKRLDEVEKQ